MTTPPQPDLDMRWFFPLFIGGWLVMLCLLSFLGGWHALAGKYRSTARSSGKLFSFASLGLGRGFGPVSYGHCLFVRFDSAGIGLSVFPLFRFFSPTVVSSLECHFQMSAGALVFYELHGGLCFRTAGPDLVSRTAGQGAL